MVVILNKVIQVNFSLLKNQKENLSLLFWWRCINLKEEQLMKYAEKACYSQKWLNFNNEASVRTTKKRIK
jgi:hypothetical protein